MVRRTVKHAWRALPEDARNAAWLFPLIGVIYAVIDSFCPHVHR